MDRSAHETISYWQRIRCLGAALFRPRLLDHNSVNPALSADGDGQPPVSNPRKTLASSLPIIAGEVGTMPSYLQEIKRFPMLEPPEEYMLAKRWREHGDREAAHKLVTSHLPARGQDRHGLSRLWLADRGSHLRGQCRPHAGGQALLRTGRGLQARDLRHVFASIQEYILRSWSLVKMGTTASQKDCSSTCARRRAGFPRSTRATCATIRSETISKRLGVGKQDVIDVNRRLGGDASLNAPLREGGEGEWQDWLVDDTAVRKRCSPTRESDARLGALRGALSVLDPSERRIFRGAPAG